MRILGVFLAASWWVGSEGQPIEGCNRCNDWIQENHCETEKPAGYLAYNASVSPKRMNIGFYSSISGSPWFAKFDNSLDLALQCTRDEINSEFFTNGDRIDLVFNDLKGSRRGAVEAALCFDRAQLPLAIGPGFSFLAIAAATISGIFKRNMIGTASSSPLLSNGEAYPFFSRAFPSDAFQGSAMVRLAANFGFKRLVTISSANDEYYEGLLRAVEKEAKAQGIMLLSKTIPSDPSYEQVKDTMKNVASSGFRVVLMMTTNNGFVLKAAHEHNAIGAGWAYISSETFFDNLGSYMHDDNASMALAKGVIGLKPMSQKDTVPYNKLKECYEARRANPPAEAVNFTLKPFNDLGAWHFYGTEALWLAARAIAKVGWNMSDSVNVREAIRSLNYVGITGDVSMDDVGDRVGAEYQVLSIVGVKEGKDSKGHEIPDLKEVGSLKTSNNKLSITETITFPGGGHEPPQDYVKECKANEDYNISLNEVCKDAKMYISFPRMGEEGLRYCPELPDLEIDCYHPTPAAASTWVVINAVGIAFSFLNLGYLIMKWKHPIIVRSQKRFLLILIIGSLLGKFAPFMLLVSAGSDSQCLILPVVVAQAFILCFGTLFVKSWRIGKILGNTSLKKVVIKDSMLFSRLFAMLLGSLILLLVMMVVDPPKLTPETQVFKASAGLHVTAGIKSCKMEHGFMSTLYMLYMFGLLLYGCFVSFQVRDVGNDFAEAKYIFIAIYNCALVAVVALGIVLELSISAATEFMIITLSIFLVTVVTEALIFFPKFTNIYHNVKVSSLSESFGSTKTRTKTGNTGGGTTSGSEGALSTTTNFTVEALRQQVKKLGAEPEA